jgi:conjugal transfer pilus assembly protein TraW
VRSPVALVCALALTSVTAFSFAAHVQARDFGQMGETFPIIEQDLLATIETRLKHLESSGKLAALEAQMRQQAISSVRRPKPVDGLSAATRKRAWLFDPSTVVENDITDAKGNMIAARGQRVNPMTFVKLTQDLVFIDGRDKAQVDWAVAGWVPLKAKIILVDGSPFDLMKPYQRRFYFDQGGQLVARFGIRHTPAIVTSAGDMLSIRETLVTAPAS